MHNSNKCECNLHRFIWVPLLSLYLNRTISAYLRLVIASLIWSRDYCAPSWLWISIALSFGASLPGLSSSTRLQSASLKSKMERVWQLEGSQIKREGNIHCSALKWASVLMLRHQGASVLIRGTTANDKLSAVIVSVCHRAELETSTIHHRGGAATLRSRIQR